jgi:uncharacterized membrane protein YuzA (DUF378 family)
MLTWLSARGKVVLAIASAIAAGLLGAALSDLVDKLSLGYTLVSLAALGVIGLSAGQLVVIDKHEKSDKELSKDVNSVAKSVLAGQEGPQNSHMSLAAQISDLANQVGMKVGSLLTSETDRFQSIAEDPSAKLILSAEKELLILDFIAGGGTWPDDAMNQILLDQVFTGIMERVKAPQSELVYKRVIQVADTSAGLRYITNANLLRHCHDIVRYRGVSRQQQRAVLRIAKQRFPFKFVLIDGKHLILQLQQYDEKQQLNLWGELQITDPTGRLISVFRQIWDQIDYEENSTRNAVAGDLATSTC